MAPSPDDSLELSIVMPCLNEAETVGVCVEKAMGLLRRAGVRGEVIVADNGSTDGSQAIAEKAGARVVAVASKGYGSALIGGFEAARGRFLIMGDSDDSYDFENLQPFIDRLREGYDVVIGNRFKGGIAPGAMPPLHRYLGNPVLTAVLNLFYRSGIGDAHCGLRALTKDAFHRLRLRTTGMEFASEMVVKAAAHKLKMCEVPTTLSPDGRSRPPHLRSFHDGWRHLRFLVLLCPQWALIIPGFVLIAAGLLVGALVLPGVQKIGPLNLDVHTLVAGSMFIILGYQAVAIGLAARIFAVREEIGPPSPFLQKLSNVFTLERGLILGAVLLVAGLAFLIWLTARWAGAGFGELDVRATLRPMIAGATLVTVGAQTILMALFYSMLNVQRQ